MSLISISAFSIPYLYVLSVLIKNKAVFGVGAIMAVISIVYLWMCYGVFRYLKTRKLLAIGIIFLLSIPFVLIINVTLSKLVSSPVIDMWDILSAFILLVLAFAFLVYDYAKYRELVK